MIPTIRAEVRKLLTVRSTYAILLICLLLEIIASGYGGGFNANAGQLNDPGHLTSEITSAVSFLSAFIALIAILLVTHEYRYNTISYTLTAARNRTQVLLSKVAVMSVFAIVTIVIFGALSPLIAWAGAALNGHHMVHQTFPPMALIGRLLFVAWAYSMFGLIISFIARIQVAAFTTYFLLPSTIEPLLAALVKKNQYYLPFISLDGVINQHPISHGRSAVAGLVWVVLGLLVSWLLFRRRDAN
jgi:ABC-2 type transport system permease protein